VQILKTLFRPQAKQLSPETGDSTMTLLTDNRNSQKPVDSLRQSHSPERHHQEMFSEGVFRRILRWEQHRAQRSPKFFLLVLMDVERVVRTDRRKTVLGELFSVLAASMREADIAGWYRENAVIGMIFTDVRATDRELLQNLICAKLRAPLLAKLGSELVEQIQFSLHFFPEEWDNPTDDWTKRKALQRFVESRNLAMTARLMKRATDIVGSLVGLIVFSPFFVAIPLAIKLTSKGPVFFKQERVGQYGLRFKFLKFRSMNNANDPSIHRTFVKQFIAGAIGSEPGADGKAVIYKLQQDSRVTQVGNFLRKTSLDELPQLINVLRGEMSLVGPRPPIPYEVESYQYWHVQRLFEAKPGITGLWQVNGRSRTTFDEMVRLDLRYARRWSLWLDFLILLQTPRAVLAGTGAY